MILWYWLPVGFLIGAVVGAFLLALVVANKDEQD